MVLVSDTSVPIDLERAGLLKAIFTLPHEFAAPDVLYERELRGEWGEHLVKLGLQVVEVSKEGVGAALRYRRQRSSLSVPDSFALALAKERAWLLLTGDNQLRELATTEKVECHGLLWLLDMLEAGKDVVQLLYAGLTAVATIPAAGCRGMKSRSAWSVIGSQSNSDSTGGRDDCTHSTACTI